MSGGGEFGQIKTNFEGAMKILAKMAANTWKARGIRRLAESAPADLGYQIFA